MPKALPATAVLGVFLVALACTALSAQVSEVACPSAYLPQLIFWAFFRRPESSATAPFPTGCSSISDPLKRFVYKEIEIGLGENFGSPCAIGEEQEDRARAVGANDATHA